MDLLLMTPRKDVKYTDVLVKAAINAGWNTERSQGYLPSPYDYNENIVLYGEPLFVSRAADSLEYEIIEPPFAMIAKLPAQYVKRTAERKTMHEAKQRTDAFFAVSRDGKMVPPKIYANGDELAESYAPDYTELLITEPVKWEVAYRYYILEDEIVAGSVYERDGNHAQDEHGNWWAPDNEKQGAYEFVMSMIEDRAVRIPPAVIFDVGFIENKGWALVDVLPVSSAELYGSDPEKVLAVLKRACLHPDDVKPGDKKWLAASLR